MRAKNRLSPYPILTNYNDDYKSGSFQACINAKEEYGKLCVHVDFELNSKYLQNLISQGDAEFLVHFECPTTSYRERIAGNKKIYTKAIPIDLITDVLEVNTFIVVAKDGIEYISDSFNDDYKGFNFNVSKNEILAIGDSVKITIKNDTRDLESLPSIIKIIKVDNAEKAMAVDTDGDDIKIKLSENVCDNYKKVGNSVYSKTAFSLVIFPALLVVLTRMISNEEDSEISERRWYQIVEKKLEEKDIALKNLSLADGTLIDACQKIFEDPIAKAFEELVEKMERENED